MMIVRLSEYDFDQSYIAGRQFLPQLAERALSQIWHPDASLSRSSPTETGGAAGVSAPGDQEGAEGKD